MPAPQATDPNPPGVPLAKFANDPNELQIKYDLYRIPFHDGQGGVPEPIAGASRNGMSNTFPKVSPDGRWIVFVECRNGELMRPDSQLYIVPAAGGQARRMRCNTPRMNSWHSFSPNGRWLVFSSKARSPYTQMYLTHIDADGNDSPPILIDNATAANRAVNIPEFVNVPPDGLRQIGGPVIDYYQLVNSAAYLQRTGSYEASAAKWRKVLELSPDDEAGAPQPGNRAAHDRPPGGIRGSFPESVRDQAPRGAWRPIPPPRGDSTISACCWSRRGASRKPWRNSRKPPN